MQERNGSSTPALFYKGYFESSIKAELPEPSWFR